MSIKTWQERLDWITSTSYQGYASQEEIDACKQAELDEIRAALARRTGERDALKADAKRYRWLREQDDSSPLFCMYGSNGRWGECGHSDIYGELLDKSIDEEMKGKS